MKNPTIANTFKLLAKHGKNGFYEGEVAEQLVKVVSDLGGYLTLDDLKHHAEAGSEPVEPISLKYTGQGVGDSTNGGIELWEHPPNGQGIVALMALGIIQELEKQGKISQWGLKDHNTTQHLHATIEALRIAFADAHWFVTDPNVVKVPSAELISEAYLSDRAKLFDPKKATSAPVHGSPAHLRSDTVYFCCRFFTAPAFRITSNNLCTSRPSNLALGGTGLEQDNVAVLDDVVLALGHDLALGLDIRLVANLLEHGVVVHDDLDEGLLEVTVDDTSSLGRLGSVTDGPLAHLIRAGCEEGTKVEGLAHGDDDLGQGRLGSNLLALLGDFLVVLEARKTLLEGHGDGKDNITRGVLLDPGGDLGEVLVLLPDVVTLAQVDEVDDGLGSKEEHGVDGLDLCDSKSAIESTMCVTN